MVTVQPNYDLFHRDMVERQILSAIFNTTEESGVRVTLMKHNLEAKDFRMRIHQQIYTAILECYENKAIPDIVNILNFRPTEYRNGNSKDFDIEIFNIATKGIASSALLEHHIMILKQYCLFEFWNHKATDILYGNWNNRDVLQVGDNIIQSYKNLFTRFTEKLTQTFEDDYEAEIKNKVDRRSKGLSTGITTSVDIIDDFTGGYSLGELVIIAARPGMGKTTYALISGWNSAMAGNIVVFFSLEMAKNQLKSKLISLLTGIDYKLIKKGAITAEELKAVVEANKYIDNSNFHIEDKIKTIEDITEKATEWANKGAKLFFMDYIQRCGSRTKMQMRELVTIISRELKSIARDNYVAMVALSQLSRAVEARDNKRPKLADLKESSSIEEDADIVAFLFRQAYYDEQVGNRPGFAELFHTEFIIGKGRDIGTNVIHLFINPIDMTIHEYNYSGNY